MNRNRRTQSRVAMVATVLLLATAGIAAAFTLRTQSIESSGGRSTGGVYTLTHSVGQPIAHPDTELTGGVFTLRGGFLSGASDPTPPTTVWMVY